MMRAMARAMVLMGMVSDRIVLFGTKGGPRIIKGGSWPSSNAIVINNQVYLIDAGLGVTRQFVEAGFDYSQLGVIFITHHHSDHNLELGGLIHTAWLGAPPHPIMVHGPKGLDHLMRHALASQAFDITTRVEDEGLADIHELVSWQEFTEGPVFEDDHVRVTALRVAHPPVEECYALKFDTGSKVVVFGADTAFFPPLADFAKGADILVHEAMHLPTARQICDDLKATKPRLWDHLSASHTSCADVGRLASMAECGHLVINHYVPEPGYRASVEDFEHAVRQTYDGHLTMGRDQLSLEI